MTCNNLGVLLKNTNRKEEAETFYREALDIRRDLARDNPAAYEVKVAETGENLADLFMGTGREKEAETLYREALSLFEKYPHRKKDVERVRREIARYFPS